MAALGLGLAAPFANLAVAQDKDPKKLRPQPGDQLVFVFGDHEGEIIAPVDLPLGGPQILAYPKDPNSGVVRNGSRLNQVLLVRLEPSELSEEVRAHAADGVVAYSAVCTHAGCGVSEWKEDLGTLFCPCHASEFDPKEDAKVVAGPAPRSLPALPLRMAEGNLVVAGGFTRKPGFRQNT
jgi:Rieske Fe-S protein